KQSEVVFLMRHLRSNLEERFPHMLTGPDLNARRRYREDGRLFLLIKKFEMNEVFSSPNLKGHSAPLFLEPEYCNGAKALSQALSSAMPEHQRVITVVELAATAQAVEKFLTQAPEIRRGRPKS
ncbi:MAG: hypothetical protein HRU27_20865, partial [Rhizobiaceae bacterium]|nr:hypothetical protein [Rhizobiaceae bacterium]